MEPIGQRAIVVYATVLPWLGSPWCGVPAVVGQAFAAALAAQAADWLELRESYPDCELVVAGDLNQDLAKRHFYGSKANRRAMETALKQSELTCLTGGSGDPVGLLTRGERASIDHICVSAGLKQRVDGPCRVWPIGDKPDRRISDHYGVVVELGMGW
ncbi:MAG: endonuclease/exonuclease/phosphatase family metal-dependent hydrolase [Cognaticolwellia sp.]